MALLLSILQHRSHTVVSCVFSSVMFQWDLTAASVGLAIVYIL